MNAPDVHPQREEGATRIDYTYVQGYDEYEVEWIDTCHFKRRALLNTLSDFCLKNLTPVVQLLRSCFRRPIPIPRHAYFMYVYLYVPTTGIYVSRIQKPMQSLSTYISTYIKMSAITPPQAKYLQR